VPDWNVGDILMIQLTRLNRQPLVVNSDLIKFIENAPDTVITLVNGEKMVVLEGRERIVDLVVQFRHRVLKGASTGPAACSARPEDLAPPNPDSKPEGA